MAVNLWDMFDSFARTEVGGVTLGRGRALDIIESNVAPDAFAATPGVSPPAAILYRGLLNGYRDNVAEAADEQAAQAAANAGADVGLFGAGSVGESLLAGAGMAAGFAIVAAILWDMAGGVPDWQVSTLAPGTPWNPAGDPEALTQLAHVPRQVISVANEAQLVAAINQVNASPGNYTINLTASIVLTGDLPAIAQPTGSVLINGEGNLLYGSNAYGGLVVNGTNATIENLIVQDFVANGSQGSSQGEGGGLVAINGANVVVDNVTLADDSATGGSSGAGLGGAYADPSSSIIVRGSSISGNGASGSQGDGIAVSLSGNLAVTTATAKKGQTTTVDGGVADQGGPGDVDMLMAQGRGTVVLTGTESFSGGVVIARGTTLQLDSSTAVGSSAVAFASDGTGVLRVEPGALGADATLAPQLSGMTAGDRVDFAGLSGTVQVQVGQPVASADGGPPVTQVTVTNGTQTETLHLVGLNTGATFTTASDGHGGTMLRMTQAVPTPTDLSEQTSQAGSVTFSGMGQPGSTVTLFQVQPGTATLLQLGTGTVGADGQFTVTPGTQPDAGKGPVTAVATDSYGNSSLFSKRVGLPAGAGGQAPTVAHGMVAPTALSIVVRVGTEAQLIAAINEANTNNSGLALAIQFTNNITLSGMADLPALEDGSAVQILGNGYTLQGDGETRGLMLFGANATIDNLTISDMVATGGSGGFGRSGGGGGAGLGGGLMVAGTSTVTLDDVNFVNDRAVGGAGGESGGTGSGSGGGGGMGGDGGSAMQNTSLEISGGGGGVGNQANGGGDSGVANQASGGDDQTAAGSGIIAGAPSDEGSGSGIDGGGGSGGSTTPVSNVVELDGKGGGIDGTYITAGWGGGGGGGGGHVLGGDGSFGGGGGGSPNQGGQGGFGGGGGGGAPLRNDEGEPGGFAGGAGGKGTNNSGDEGDDTDQGGGGGGGMGGAVFVAQGAKLTVDSSSSTGDSVQGGQGQDGGQNGQAYGSGWFFQGNQSVTFEAQAGQTTTISDGIADEAGSQSGATGTVGVIVEGKGTVALDASNTYSGGTIIDNGHLELGTTGAAGAGNITFAKGTTGTLKLDPAMTQGLTNVITGFSHRDSIDLSGFAWSGGTSAKVIGMTTTPAGTSATVVSISGSNGQQEQLLFHGLPADASFVTSSDGDGGTRLRLAPTSSPAASQAAGHVCNLGSNDTQAELRTALEGTSPAPGAVPEGDRGSGSGAAGREPPPVGGVVALPGAEENHTIASAGHDSQGDTSSVHHTR